MTHPTRFMQTILASPAADGPRISYANWLDACGNPLGEFIRLQCALASARTRRPSLEEERRERALLARHEERWASALAGRVEWCSFRRGFIEEVSLTDRQLIRNGSEIFRMAPVVDVHLKSDGRRLADLPDLPDVSHTLFLDLSSQGLGNAGIAKLASAPLLKHVHGLNLGSNRIGDDGLGSLIDSSHVGALRELYLHDNPITDEGIRILVLSSLLERLQVLDLSFTRISHESVDILTRILGSKLVV